MRVGRVMTGRPIPPGALPPGETVESHACLDLQPLPHLVSRARRFVAEQVPPLTAETEASVLLLTSELVTNGMIHARTPLQVGVVVSAGYVLVTVHDLDLDLGPAQPTGLDRDGGRGLTLVRALADATAMHRPPEGGKTAWFRVARSGHSSEGQAS
ncbi:MAG: hypothetical protein NVSMB13_01600 [Mycobacteriales bacterium]